MVGEHGVALKTRDGGGVWDLLGTHTPRALNGLHFLNEQTGWLVGDGGVILYTNDHGRTLTPQGPSACGAADLYGVQAYEGTREAYVVGQVRFCRHRGV